MRKKHWRSGLSTASSSSRRTGWALVAVALVGLYGNLALWIRADLATHTPPPEIVVQCDDLGIFPGGGGSGRTPQAR